MKKLLTLLITLLMLTTLTGCGSKITTIKKEVNQNDGIYKNQTVILHTNDVHGAIEGYSYLPPLKKALESQGATVILMDSGDFSEGTIYVSTSKGESAVTLMNQVGYDVVTLGNHDFDPGFEVLEKNLSKAMFKTIASNVYKNNELFAEQDVIIKVGDLKIGVFALVTPETLTKANPENLQGLSIPSKNQLYEIAQQEVDKLKKEADIIVCLSHLGVDEESEGNRSYDVYNNVEGIDIMLDAHSHTVMMHGENDEPIQSTGTAFENIGSVVIDNETKKIVKHELIPTADLEQDKDVLATAKNVIDTVDAEYDKVFATSEVELDGVKEHVRSSETNMGDLITDAIVWSAINENTLDVDKDHVVAIVNSGGIRSSIGVGEITKKDVFNVLPFGNTIAINYLKGSELLETLEASTFLCPEIIGGFPQISGMKIQVDTSKEYDAGDLYPGTTYNKPNSIKRVTILEVNGKPFNENDTYAVVNNNFTSAGGDTYYALRKSRVAGNAFDMPVTLADAVMNYISYELGGVVGKDYEKPQGRITIIAN